MRSRRDTGYATRALSVCLGVMGWSTPLLADDSSPSAPLYHESVFSTYQAYVETPDESWPALNEKVRRIGGWRSYALEIYEAQKAESSKQTPINTPSRQEHNHTTDSADSGGERP